MPIDKTTSFNKFELDFYVYPIKTYIRYLKDFFLIKSTEYGTDIYSKDFPLIIAQNKDIEDLHKTETTKLRFSKVKLQNIFNMYERVLEFYSNSKNETNEAIFKGIYSKEIIYNASEPIIISLKDIKQEHIRNDLVFALFKNCSNATSFVFNDISEFIKNDCVREMYLSFGDCVHYIGKPYNLKTVQNKKQITKQLKSIFNETVNKVKLEINSNFDYEIIIEDAKHNVTSDIGFLISKEIWKKAKELGIIELNFVKIEKSDILNIQSEINSYKAQLEKELGLLNYEQTLFFIWLCSVRVLPFLAREIDEEYLYNVFYALDVIHDVSSIKKLGNKVIIDIANKIAACDSKNVSKIQAANAIGNAVSFSVASSKNYAVYSADNAAVAARFEGIDDLKTILISDIENIAKNQYDKLINDIFIYNTIWDDFQNFLSEIGCKHWGELYANR